MPIIKRTCMSPAANNISLGAKSKVVASIGQQWCCALSTKAFRSEAALATHRFTVHQITRASRQVVDESATCYFCQLQFPSRVACVDHLESKSPICREFMLRHILPHGLVDVDKTFWKPPKTRQSVVRLEGPVPFLDGDELPIELAAFWDQSCRHPLGKNRAYHASVDLPFTSLGGAWVAQYCACEAGFFSQCSDDCLLCRGCVEEEWLFAS